MGNALGDLVNQPMHVNMKVNPCDGGSGPICLTRTVSNVESAME